MTPLRVEDITLYCEDSFRGRCQRILEAAIETLYRDLPFAAAVRPIGISSKNDVQIRTKYARAQTEPSLRVFGLRDRDFLVEALVLDWRGRAFDRDAQRVTPWPLPRHCIESYLLDADVVGKAVPELEPAVLAAIDAAASERFWCDVVRGTLEDLTYRQRAVRPASFIGRPVNRAEALRSVLNETSEMQKTLAHEGAEERLTAHLDKLAADMTTDGPLRCRVDGRELVYDVEVALRMARGTLLDRLARSARLRPPAALVTDLRRVLEAIPTSWRAEA